MSDVDGALNTADRGRLEAVRRAIERPADVFLAVRMISWALVLPAVARLVPLASLAPRLWREPREPAEGTAARVVALTAAIYGRRRPLRNNCLVRSLLAYRFLAEAGADPRLLVGVRRGTHIDGHVWVTVMDRPIHESLASLAEFRPVVVFASHGRPEQLEEPGL